MLGIASIAAGLTWLGVPVAEFFEVPDRVVSGSLQFAAGIITALVAFSLMPPAVRAGPQLWVVLGFFAGGAAFVLLEFVSARRLVSRPEAERDKQSLGLYVGILADLVIDGVVIGVGSSLTLGTGLLLAQGMAVSTAPLALRSRKA